MLLFMSTDILSELFSELLRRHSKCSRKSTRLCTEVCDDPASFRVAHSTRCRWNSFRHRNHDALRRSRTKIRKITDLVILFVRTSRIFTVP
jgi:hypothetical protein